MFRSYVTLHRIVDLHHVGHESCQGDRSASFNDVGAVVRVRVVSTICTHAPVDFGMRRSDCPVCENLFGRKAL